MENNRTNQNLKDFVDSLQAEWLEEVPNLKADPISVVARLVRLNYYIERRVDSNFSRYGLTRGEFEVLAVLTRNPHKEITPKILQTKILITSGGLSNRISKLEAKGLLVRELDPTDRRGVILRVTPKGRALTLSAVNSHMETEQALIKGLSVSERATLASLLKKLIVTQDQKLTKDALP
mgnify:CR=1 FL=1